MDTVQERTLSVTASSAKSVRLEVVAVTPDLVAVHFVGLPGNDPRAYSNLAAIWQSDLVGYDRPPLAVQQLTETSRMGDVVFNGLLITRDEYTVGYSVGPPLAGGQKYGNVCAAAYIPAGISNPNDCVYQSMTLALIYISTNTVAVRFNAPAGYSASTNGSWVAIWQSSEASYTMPPLAGAMVPSAGSSGTVVLTNIELLRDETYTVAIFTSGWNTDPRARDMKTMGAAVTFAVGT